MPRERELGRWCKTSPQTGEAFAKSAVKNFNRVLNQMPPKIKELRLSDDERADKLASWVAKWRFSTLPTRGAPMRPTGSRLTSHTSS